MFTIAVDNQSTVVTALDLKHMVDALNRWVPLVAQAWGARCPSVIARHGVATANIWRFLIIDTSDQVPDALAWHEETNDNVCGYILAKTVLDNGGVVLYKDARTPTVASALAHEIAEALLDPCCNQWLSPNQGTLIYAKEIADPVQDNIIAVKLPDRTTVGLSDFILPSWADPEATKKPFNYMNTLSRPFEVAPGGYVVQLDTSTGDVTYVFGQKVPEWVRSQKLASRKCSARMGACKKKPQC